jgi:hypothetical protein
MRSFRSPGVGAVVAFVAVMCMLHTDVATQTQPQPDRSLSGRLATVEPANRRVTIVPDGEVSLVEFFVAEDAKVVQGERALSLPELVIQVGRRATIAYRDDGNRRVAEHLVIEPEG